jgi:hypothetical protein
MKMSLKMEHGGMAMPMGDMDEGYYPEFTYDSPEPLDLPDEGVMKIRFRKERSSERMMGDHKMHSCTVSVLSIESVKSVKKVAEDDAPTKSDHSTEEALDKIMSEKMSSKEAY